MWSGAYKEDARALWRLCAPVTPLHLLRMVTWSLPFLKVLLLAFSLARTRALSLSLYPCVCGSTMGAGENSALTLDPAKLPSGVTPKMLLTTAPYNAQNPQTNQVLSVAIFRCASMLFGATLTAWVEGRRSTAMPSTTSSSGAQSSRGKTTRNARRSRHSSCPSALRAGYASFRLCARTARTCDDMPQLALS